MQSQAMFFAMGHHPRTFSRQRNSGECHCHLFWCATQLRCGIHWFREMLGLGWTRTAGKTRQWNKSSCEQPSSCSGRRSWRCHCCCLWVSTLLCYVCQRNHLVLGGRHRSSATATWWDLGQNWSEGHETQRNSGAFCSDANGSHEVRVVANLAATSMSDSLAANGNARMRRSPCSKEAVLLSRLGLVISLYGQEQVLQADSHECVFGDLKFQELFVMNPERPPGSERPFKKISQITHQPNVLTMAHLSFTKAAWRMQLRLPVPGLVLENLMLGSEPQPKSTTWNCNCWAAGPVLQFGAHLLTTQKSWDCSGLGPNFRQSHWTTSVRKSRGLVLGLTTLLADV